MAFTTAPDKRTDTEINELEEYRMCGLLLR